MKTFRYFCALALVAPALPAAAGGLEIQEAACNGEGTPIRVDVEGLKDRTGRVKVELWPANDEDFLKDGGDLKKQGKFFARVWSDPPKTGAVKLCIRAPHPGRYALVVTHDRGGKDKFSIWRDGAGIVANNPIGRSKPKLDQSVIVAGSNGTTISIRMQYLRGFSGFSPGS